MNILSKIPPVAYVLIIGTIYASINLGIVIHNQRKKRRLGDGVMTIHSGILSIGKKKKEPRPLPSFGAGHRGKPVMRIKNDPDRPRFKRIWPWQRKQRARIISVNDGPNRATRREQSRHPDPNANISYNQKRNHPYRRRQEIRRR